MIVRGATTAPVAKSAVNGGASRNMSYPALTGATASTSWILGFGGHRTSTNVNAATAGSMTIRSAATVAALGMHSLTGVTSFGATAWSQVSNNSGWQTIDAEILADTTAPSVTSIVPVTASPTNSPTATFAVTFSEAVTGVSAANFSVTTAGSITGASVTGVTGTGSTRTVTVNTGSGEGAIRLDLGNTAGVTDLGGNTLLSAFTTGGVLSVDRLAPTVSSITPVTASPTNASSATFDVTFSESVTGVTASNFGLATTGLISGASVTSVTGTGSTRTVTVDTGSFDGTIRLDLTSAAGIADSIGNAMSATYSSGGVLTVDKTPPTAVVVSGSNVTTSSVLLSWTAASDGTGSGVVAYQVYDGVVAVGAPVSGTSTTISGLAPGSTHSFTVRALDAAGNSGGPSNVASVTTDLNAAPTTSASINPTAPNGASGWYVSTPLITLTADIPGITYYSWTSASGPWTVGGSTLGISGSHTLYFYSSAAGSLDESSRSFGPLNVDVSPPVAPSVSPSSLTTSSVTLSWPAVADADSGIDYYEIRDGASVIATTSATSRTITGLVPGSSYSYTVTAYDVAGNVGAASTPVNVTTPLGVAPTTTASISPASANGSNGWYVSTPLVTLVSDLPGSTHYSWISASGPWTTYLTSLPAPSGTNTLSFYSTASGASDESPKSFGPIKVDVTAPGTPVVTGSNITASSVDLSWPGVTDADSGIDYYEIRDGASVIATTSATSRTITGLVPGSSHSYTVTAYDVAGNVGAASAPVNVTTPLGVAPTTTASISPASANGSNGWYVSTPLVTLVSDLPGSTHYSWISASGPWTTYLTSLPAPSGTNTLSFYSTASGASDESPKSFGPIKVDVTAPGTPVVTGSNITASSVDLSWPGVTDADSGIDYYEIRDGASVIATTSATSRTITGLVPGSSHSYTVTAYDIAGNVGSGSNAVPVTTNQYPAPVTTLSIPSPDGASGWYVTTPLVTLNLEAGSTAYYSWFSATGPWTLYVGPVPAPSGTNTMYFYASKPGSPDEVAKSTGPIKVDVANPGTPSVTYNNLTAISVNLSWGAVADTDSGVDFYRIYDGASLVATTTATSRTVSGLTPGSSHSFTVQAVDVAGRVGAASAAVPVDMPLNGAPTTTLTKTPSAANGSNGWYVSAPVLSLDGGTGTTSYYQWDSAAVGGWTLYAGPFPAISGTHTLYFYSAKSGSTDETPKNSGPIKVDLAAPSTPAPTASAVTASSVSLSWPAATDGGSGVANYIVYDSLNNPVVNTASTSTNLSGLTGSTTYTYRVRAFDAAGNASGDGVVTFTTAVAAQPFPYTVTIPAAGGGTNVTLDFSSVTTTPTTTATQIAPRQPAPAPSLTLVGQQLLRHHVEPGLLGVHRGDHSVQRGRPQRSSRGGSHPVALQDRGRLGEHHCCREHDHEHDHRAYDIVLRLRGVCFPERSAAARLRRSGE